MNFIVQSAKDVYLGGLIHPMDDFNQPLIDKINALRKESQAVILAHNYELGEVQDIADFVGDSLELSQKAAKTDARRDRFLRRSFYGRNSLDFISRQKGSIPRYAGRLSDG